MICYKPSFYFTKLKVILPKISTPTFLSYHAQGPKSAQKINISTKKILHLNKLTSIQNWNGLILYQQSYSIIPNVHLSVCKVFGENVLFLALIQDKCLKFLEKNPLTYKNLFFIKLFFSSVCRLQLCYFCTHSLHIYCITRHTYARPIRQCMKFFISFLSCLII